MTRNSRKNFFPLWAGLLILGGLALPYATASERVGELSVHTTNGLVSVKARAIELQDVLEAVATQSDLRLVQHVTLDRVVSFNVKAQPLAGVLDELLKNNSYQLFQPVAGEDLGETGYRVPGTLWIFSDGLSLVPAATIFFEAVLNHGSFAEKKEAIRELGRLATPDAVRTLSLALADDDERVRDAALGALSHIGSNDALAVIASAANAPDPWTRSEAITALATGVTESAVQYLTLAMSDSDPRVRMSVVDALAEIPTEQAVEVLSQALQDDDPDVRMHAADALEEVGDEIAFRTFMRARADDEPDLPDGFFNPAPSVPR